MIQSRWIPGEFPSMNEIIAAAKSGRGRSNAYSRMKARFTAIAMNAVSGMNPVSSCSIHCQWTSKNSRKDPDNVAAGVKFVLDGLVNAKILPGDGRKHVVGISHSFVVSKIPGVQIIIHGMVTE